MSTKVQQIHTRVDKKTRTLASEMIAFFSDHLKAKISQNDIVIMGLHALKERADAIREKRMEKKPPVRLDNSETQA